MILAPIGAAPGGSEIWNLSGIQFKSGLTTYMLKFSLLSRKMWISWPRVGFAEAGDYYSPVAAPPGGFRVHILVGGCSFMLSGMFMTRINYKTLCCNLFVVLPALDRIILISYTFVP